MKTKADFGLMLVTDRRLAGGRPIEKIIEAAVSGGVTIVQLREKEATTREFVALGRRVADILRPRRIPLIINDRVDVALAVVADGVHLGPSDMSPADARAILGPRAIIGLSVENENQAVRAEGNRLDVDYLGVSPVFATPTKPDAGGGGGAGWGIEGLWRLRPLVRMPLVAIGSIKADNAARVLEAGADGLAVVSAICAADDPAEAARALRAILDKARARVGAMAQHGDGIGAGGGRSGKSNESGRAGGGEGDGGPADKGNERGRERGGGRRP